MSEDELDAQRKENLKNMCKASCCDKLLSQLGAPNPPTANFYDILTTIINNLIPTPTPSTAIAPTPRHTRFVALSWGTSNPPPDYYFTDIPSALASIVAETPNPTRADAYQIILFPGTYGDDTTTLQLVSNVNIYGFERRDTTIAYAVNWDVGFGINAGGAGAIEQVCFRGLILTGGYTESVSPTKPGAVQSVAMFFDTEVRDGDVTFTGRTANIQDYFQMFDSFFFSPAVSFTTGGNINFYQTFVEVNTMVIQAAAAGDIFYTFDTNQQDGAVTFINVYAIITMSTIASPMTTSGVCTIYMLNCAVDRGSSLNVNAGSNAYLMGSQYSPTFLSGAGNVDRTITQMTVVGSGVATFATPYVNANYNVIATPQVGGVMALGINTKTTTGFTYVGTAGVTYDITVVQGQTNMTIA
jgi:hypothetical protein